MIRNSSFFWASDDLLRDDNDDQPWNSLGVSSRHVRSSSEGVMRRLRTEGAFESTALVKNNMEYGSANQLVHIPTERRKLFELASPKDNYYGVRTPQRSDNTNSPDQKFVFSSIRFQVVIWHIGEINVQSGHVKMRFRITLFWNDNRPPNDTNSTPSIKSQHSQNSVWIMEGRQNAYRKEFNNNQESSVKEMIDVPPVSVLNAVELDTVTPPEITMLNAQTRSMRWTCMYNATLSQGDHMSVKDFPHDNHCIKLKVGILAHRNRGGRWDHNVHKLELARDEDSQGSTRIPYGLVVDHCHVPDFAFDKDSLLFEFLPLTYGRWTNSTKDRDVYLQVTLPVSRQSQHYDTSILPMLIMLNIIAITCLTRNFASATAATEIMLSIAFVQVGIRLTLDNRLPSVGYQIKMQKVMNCCFWLLSGLVLESNFVFFLVTKRGWETSETDNIDWVTACVALMYNAYILVVYFRGKAG